MSRLVPPPSPRRRIFTSICLCSLCQYMAPPVRRWRVLTGMFGSRLRSSCFLCGRDDNVDTFCALVFPRSVIWLCLIRLSLFLCPQVCTRLFGFFVLVRSWPLFSFSRPCFAFLASYFCLLRSSLFSRDFDVGPGPVVRSTCPMFFLPFSLTALQAFP